MARSGSAWCPAGRAWTSALSTRPSRTGRRRPTPADGQSRRVPRRRGHRRVLAVPRAARAGRAQRSGYPAVRTAGSASSGAGAGAMRASALLTALRSTSSCAWAVSAAWATFALPNVKLPPRDLHRRRRRILSEDARRVHVAEHDPTILTTQPDATRSDRAVLGAPRDKQPGPLRPAGPQHVRRRLRRRAAVPPLAGWLTDRGARRRTGRAAAQTRKIARR